MLVFSCSYDYRYVIEFELWDCGVSCFASLPRIAFAPLGLSWLHVNFKIVFTYSVRHGVGILIETALSLYVSFGRMAILTTLVLPIQDGVAFLFSDVLLKCHLHTTVVVTEDWHSGTLLRLWLLVAMN